MYLVSPVTTDCVLCDGAFVRQPTCARNNYVWYWIYDGLQNVVPRRPVNANGSIGFYEGRYKSPEK